MKKMALIILVAVLTGCDLPKIAVQPPVGAVVADPVTIDAPAVYFVKTYKERISRDIELTVKSTRTPYLIFPEDGVEYVYSLRQDEHHAWVRFECDNVADKILDLDLVPIVSKECEVLHQVAKAFWKQNNPPKQFTDPDGAVWTRQ
jgi:hypothetical protein